MPLFPVLLGDWSYPLALAEGWSSPSLMPQLALITDHMKLRPSWVTLRPKKENIKHYTLKKRQINLIIKLLPVSHLPFNFPNN